jgi:hypothetical protein
MKKLSPTSSKLVHWIAVVPSSHISFATFAKVSSSRQSQTDLNHFRVWLVGGALFHFHLIVSRSVGETSIHSCVKSCTVVLAIEKYWSGLRRTTSRSSNSQRLLRETGALRPHNSLGHEDGFTHGRLHVVDDAAEDQNLQHGRG